MLYVQCNMTCKWYGLIGHTSGNEHLLDSRFVALLSLLASTVRPPRCSRPCCSLANAIRLLPVQRLSVNGSLLLLLHLMLYHALLVMRTILVGGSPLMMLPDVPMQRRSVVTPVPMPIHAAPRARDGHGGGYHPLGEGMRGDGCDASLHLVKKERMVRGRSRISRHSRHGRVQDRLSPLLPRSHTVLSTVEYRLVRGPQWSYWEGYLPQEIPMMNTRPIGLYSREVITGLPSSPVEIVCLFDIAERAITMPTSQKLALLLDNSYSIADSCLMRDRLARAHPRWMPLRQVEPV